MIALESQTKKLQNHFIVKTKYLNSFTILQDWKIPFTFTIRPNKKKLYICFRLHAS